MGPRVAVLREPPAAADHYLKIELYARVSAEPRIFEFLEAAALDGLWYSDLEQRGNAWISPRYKELLGYRDDEGPSSSAFFQETILPEDLIKTQQNLAAHCADPSTPFDQTVRFRHKDGSIVWVRCRGTAIRDASGKAIRMLGAHTDVTAIKQAEERLRALYEASAEMSFVGDLETATIIECNHALHDACGGSNLTGLRFTELCDGVSKAIAKNVFELLRTQAEVKDVEINLRRATGGCLTVLFSALAVRDLEAGRPFMRGWCRDITHLRRFANVEVLIGALPGGVVVTDKLNIIRSTNPAADQLFGYAKGELTGRPLSWLITDLPHAEKLGFRKDGSYFPIHTEIATVELGEGAFQLVTVVDLAARKGIESALRDSERRFRQLTESLPQLVWTCNAQGACDYFSPQWIEYTGVPESEQLGFGWLNAVHPEDRDRFFGSWSASVREGVPFHGESRLLRRDGEYRWFDARGTPLRDSDNRIVKWFGASTDVTERKQIEADQSFLLRLGAKMQASSGPQEIAAVATRMVSEHFNVSICSFNLIDVPNNLILPVHSYVRGGAQPAGTAAPLTAWATEALTLRLAAGEAIYFDDTSVHPDTSPTYAKSFGPGGVTSVIAVPMRRDGKLVGVLALVQGKARRWTQREVDLARSVGERLWFAYDAARALAAERDMHFTLAANEERLQLGVQSAAIGIWENDRVNGTIHWDPISRAVFGFPPDIEISEDVVMASIHPDDLEGVKKSIEAYVDPNGPGHFETDYRIITQNGKGVRHIYAQGQMFFEGTGANRRGVRAIGTVQDITDLKRGEQALRRANSELEQFAYAAAHDLQEPLRNVGLAAQLLSSRYEGALDEEAHMLLQTAIDGAGRMQAMVKDLLTYTRVVIQEEGAVLFADPNVVLARALQNLSTAIAETNAEITSDTLPPVRMSELHLLQVFQNLVGNSLKYFGTERPRIHVGIARRSVESVFYVRDNGSGIAPEYHQRAFGVFKRLHSQDVPGTGIGLALCKRIVEHYGGKIWIESAGINGTTLLFTPPLAG